MYPSDKIVDLGTLSTICQNHRRAGGEIALTSGCFDLIHPGHIHYLCEAARRGNLVVGINSDAFVKRLKGPSRPILGEKDRAFVVASFFPVWLVVVFDDDYALIEAVRPRTYVASMTSTTRIWDDEKRVLLLAGMSAQIVEMGKGKADSTTDIIGRVAKVIENDDSGPAPVLAAVAG